MEWRIKPVDRSVCVVPRWTFHTGWGFLFCVCVCLCVPSLVGPAVSRNRKENFFFFYLAERKTGLHHTRSRCVIAANNWTRRPVESQAAAAELMDGRELCLTENLNNIRHDGDARSHALWFDIRRRNSQKLSCTKPDYRRRKTSLLQDRLVYFVLKKIVEKPLRHLFLTCSIITWNRIKKLVDVYSEKNRSNHHQRLFWEQNKKMK